MRPSISSKKTPPRPFRDAIRTRKKLTLKDVASALGVSRTTVSNVFNRPEQLSKALRDDILSKSRELGYFGPDPAARALRRREIREVAVVFHHELQFAFEDPLSIEFLRGVATELDRRGMTLQLIPNLGRTDSWAAAFHTTADALVVFAEIDPELAPEVKATNKPLVLVDTHVPGVPSVRIDDRHGAALAMDHALATKPERVIVLRFRLNERQRDLVFGSAKVPRNASVSVERMAGYVAAARARGWSPERIDWLEIDDANPESAVAPLEQLLQRLAPRTRVALVAISDRIALAALNVLQATRHIDVSAVVGFDDIPAAAAAGLTTVRQDARLKGERAVQLVLEGGKSVVLPLELVARGT